MHNTIIVGDGCNLGCTYCFQQCKTGKNKVNIEHVEAYLKEVYGPNNPLHMEKDEPQILNFVGGEPFLYIDIMERAIPLAFELMEKQGYVHPTISISTNGYNLDTDRAKQLLNKYQDDIFLEFSVDGTKESHDKYRISLGGSPTYDKVWQNFLNYKNIRRVLRWTLDPSTIGEYANALISWIDKGYTYQTHFNTDSVYDKEAIATYYANLKRLFDWYKNHSVSWILENKVEVYQADYKPQFTQLAVKTLWCIGNRATLDYDGEVIKCIYQSNVSRQRPDDCGYGNITKQVDWEKAATPTYYESVNYDKLDPECARCPIGNYCITCPVVTYMKTGVKAESYASPDRGLCNAFALKHLEKVLFTNYWIKIYRENVPENEWKVKDVQGIKHIYDGDMTVTDILLPKCWALEIISEEDYNFLCDLTESVGGHVTPLETKFYAQEDVDAFMEVLAEQGNIESKRVNEV